MNRVVFLKIGLLLSYVSMIFYYATASALSQILYFASIFIILLYSINERIHIRDVIFIFLSLLFFSFFSFFSRSYPYYYSIAILLYGLGALVMAYGFLKLERKAGFSVIFYYIYMVFLWVNFLKLGFLDPDNYNEIFAHSSRNVVSAFLLIITILVGACYHADGKKQPLLVYILTFISSLILYGRSGIAISLILFCYAFYDNYGKRVYWLALFIPLFALLFVNYYAGLEYYFTEESSFKNGLESPRQNMRDEYLNGIFYSPQDLFFGRRYFDCCVTVMSYESNPHNSFIVGHARYGIFHTLFFVVLFLSTFLFLKQKKVFVFFAFLIFTRYFFDQLGLFSPLDFILFFIFLLIFKFKREVC